MFYLYLTTIDIKNIKKCYIKEIIKYEKCMNSVIFRKCDISKNPEVSIQYDPELWNLNRKINSLLKRFGLELKHIFPIRSICPTFTPSHANLLQNIVIQAWSESVDESHISVASGTAYMALANN